MKKFLRFAGILIATLVLVIIPSDGITPDEPSLAKLSNPAYDYCAGIMGYEYQVITQADGGQTGMCKLPDDTTCPDWDFYSGKCGGGYSWCEQHGYNLVTRRDGKDPYSPEYAVCVDQKAADVGGVSSLSDLDDLAVNGIVPSKPTQNGDAPDPATTKSDYLVPASFDWRTFAGQDWITPVKNQLTCGACWAFSTVGLTEAQQNILAKNPNLDLDLSEQYLVSDCFVSGNCSAGIEGSALEYIRDFGIPDEACYPYRNADSLCSERCSDYASRLKFLPHADWSYSYSRNRVNLT